VQGQVYIQCHYFDVQTVLNRLIISKTTEHYSITLPLVVTFKQLEKSFQSHKSQCLTIEIVNKNGDIQ
jgi:hypothetical protein